MRELQDLEKEMIFSGANFVSLVSGLEKIISFSKSCNPLEFYQIKSRKMILFALILTSLRSIEPRELIA